MTTTLEFWNFLIANPTFYTLLLYLETILVDINLVTGTLYHPQEIGYVRLGCGMFATKLCEIR